MNPEDEKQIEELFERALGQQRFRITAIMIRRPQQRQRRVLNAED